MPRGGKRRRRKPPTPLVRPRPSESLMPDPTPEPEGLREKLDALVRLAIAHNAEDYCVRDARAAVWAEVQRLLNELEARLVDGAFTQAVANTREMRARELEGEKVDRKSVV